MRKTFRKSITFLTAAVMLFSSLGMETQATGGASVRSYIAEGSFGEVDGVPTGYWSIDDAGNLTISGAGDYLTVGGDTVSLPPWNRYASQIRSARVLAENGLSTGYAMFKDCGSLVSVDLENFNASGAENMEHMFDGCSSLSTIITPNYAVKSDVALPTPPSGKAWCDMDGNVYKKLPTNRSSSIMLEVKTHAGGDETGDDSGGSSGGGSSMFDPPDEIKSVRINSGTLTIDLHVTEPVGIDFTASEELLWSSSDTGIATVDSAGRVTPKRAGNVSIKAEAPNGDFDVCYVTVTDNGGTGGGGTGGGETGGGTGGETGGGETGGGTGGGETGGGTEGGGTGGGETGGDETGGTPGFVPTDDGFGDIDPKDRPASVDKIPSGLWVAQSSIRGEYYTGKAIKPEPRVYYGNIRLVEGSDYSLKYKNNTAASSGSGSPAPTVIAKGKGAFKGTASATFPIYQKSIEDPDMLCLFTDVYASGQRKNPPFKLTLQSPTKTLKLGKDYTLTVKSQAGAQLYSWTSDGAYFLEVNGIKNYTGMTTLQFDITPKVPTSKLTVSGIKSQKYTGSAVTPSVTVKYKKEILKEGEHYFVSYSNNVLIGNAVAYIIGMDEYHGTVKRSFKITGTPIKKAKVAGIVTPSEYAGTAIMQPQAALTYKGEPLTLGKDYTVSYKRNVNKGTASVIYTGIGAYSGTLTKKYKIKALNVAGDTAKTRIKVEGPTQEEQASGAYKPKVYDTIGGATVMLREGRDYTVSRSRGAVVIKGRGNYTGTLR